MESQSNSSAKRPSFVRAFLPLWLGLLWTVAAFAIDYHQRHAPQTFLSALVTVEGEGVERDFTVEVNGHRQRLDVPVGIGWSRRISAPDAEPVKRTGNDARMARPRRILHPGAWYHVTARGIERRVVFRDDRDCAHSLESLEGVLRRS